MNRSFIRINAAAKLSNGMQVDTGLIFDFIPHTGKISQTLKVPCDYEAYASEDAFLAGKDKVWLEDENGVKQSSITFSVTEQEAGTIDPTMTYTKVIEAMAAVTGLETTDFEKVTVTIPDPE